MKIREKVSNDFEQCRLNHDIDIRERQQIEELLTRDLTAKKEEIRKWISSKVLRNDEFETYAE